MGEELDKYSSIVDVIKYFIDSRRYGVVDRMALAMSSESVEVALYDMLRLIDSLMARRVVLELKVKTREGEKTYTLNCCEIDKDLGYGVKGVIKHVVEGETVYGAGDEIYCMPCPLRPSDEELKSFLQEISRNPFLARKIALIAFGKKSGKEGE